MLNRVQNSECYKKICNKNNYNILFYLLGCTCLFFSCQTLKSTSIISKNNTHYNRCLKKLEHTLYSNELIRICEILNHKENFQNFVYNLLFTWLIVYGLINDILKKQLLSPLYWTVTYLSAIIFSLLGEIRMFQFSIDSNTKYNTGRTVTISFICILFFIVCMRQIYFNKVNFNLIFSILLIYSLIYLIFFSISNNIIFHLHHAIVAGFLSLFFTDFESKFDLCIHAIMIGITIQGLTFFNTQELFLFYISDTPPPNTLYMIITTCISLFTWTGLLFVKNKYCNYYINTNTDMELRERMLS